MMLRATIATKRLMENKPESLAALLNITTAMSQIFLPVGTPLDYLKQVIWDDSAAAGPVLRLVRSATAGTSAVGGCAR